MQNLCRTRTKKKKDAVQQLRMCQTALGPWTPSKKMSQTDPEIIPVIALSNVVQNDDNLLIGLNSDVCKYCVCTPEDTVLYRMRSYFPSPRSVLVVIKMPNDSTLFLPFSIFFRKTKFARKKPNSVDASKNRHRQAKADEKIYTGRLYADRSSHRSIRGCVSKANTLNRETIRTKYSVHENRIFYCAG